jgi:K+ transporter
VLLVATLLSAVLMPAVVFGMISDTVDAAIIAGIFSIVNTYLNLKMLRQIGVTRKVARESSDALMEIANVRRSDKPATEGER